MKKIIEAAKRLLPHHETLLVVLIVSYFLFKTIFFATTIKPDISPDEFDHFYVSFLHMQHADLVLPASLYPDTVEIYNTFPFLYHFLMGKLLWLNFLNIHPLVYLRFLNICLSLGTVLFTYGLLSLVSVKTITRITGLLIITNIPMFTFLSSGISYDNLVNLLSAACCYFFFVFLLTDRFNAFLVFLSTLLLGTLTKVAFLPLALFFLLLLIFDTLCFKKLNSRWNQLKKSIRKPSVYGWGLLIIVLLVGNMWFYGKNLKAYGTINPYCEQVLSFEKCMKQSGFQAITALGRMVQASKGESLLNIFSYFFSWGAVAVKGIFGIYGHQLMFRSTIALLPYYCIFLTGFFYFIRRFKLKNNAVMSYALFLPLAYAAVIYFKFSYPNYRQIGFVEGSIHGRYLFPVLPLGVMLFCYYVFETGKLKRISAVGITLLLVIVFAGGDLPYFLCHADPSWFAQGWDLALPSLP